MQEIPFTRFSRLKARDIKECKSFRVTSDGELLCIVVVPQGEPLIRNNLISQVDEMVLINNVFGRKEVEECFPKEQEPMVANTV